MPKEKPGTQARRPQEKMYIPPRGSSLEEWEHFLSEGHTPDEVAVALDRAMELGKERVLVIKGWCKGCGLCVAICPKKALEMDEGGHCRLAYPDRCILCGMCEHLCPDFAITLLEPEETLEEVA